MVEAKKIRGFPVNFKVVIASPYWGISGVNVYSMNLARGLVEREIPATILLTGLDYLDSHLIQTPSDISFDRLPVKENSSWRVRWQEMIHYLEENRPCIYIPNADFWHSCVSPKLPKDVSIVGIVHSDDPLHYDHVARLGKYWNVIVAVSKTIAVKIVKIDPAFAEKLVVIPCGVSSPDVYPQHTRTLDAPLKIVYAGRLVHQQKRILDLPKIFKAVCFQKVPVEFFIIGEGSEKEQLLNEFKHLDDRGAIHFLGSLSNEEVVAYFQQSDVFILTSEFEGMPVSLLEAMGQGCVPVVTDIDSGIPELIEDGVNGYRLPVGDIQKFAECLANLYHDPDQYRKISLNAYDTIKNGGYQIQDMVDSYTNLFCSIMQEIESDSYKRPKGRIIPPPMLQGLWKKGLPEPILDIARFVRQALSK